MSSSLNRSWQWGDDQECSHAYLSYEEVAAAGPPARPLDFPAPKVFRCERIDIRARDHRSGTVYNLNKVIVRSGQDCGTPPGYAYLVKKKIGKSTYGTLQLCIVLKRIPYDNEKVEDRQDLSLANDKALWESTDSLVVIKASEWKKIHAMRGRHLEDPIREISAMQLLGNYHPHVIGSHEVLQDDRFLYCVMPYLSGGDLYGRLAECYPKRIRKPNSDKCGFDETQARVWFQQLLMALYHLQKKGVCHRDICLDNLLLDEKDRLVLVDPGMALRVPYCDPSNYGGVTDVSAGTERRLMVTQGQGGNLMFAPPEVVEGQEAVDPFALDLWSSGIVLFVMLVGLAPFKWASSSDKRFCKISKGGLKELVDMLDIPLSPEACDLLQGFFWKEPRRRLSLGEIMDHPWVQGKQFVNISFKPQKALTYNPANKRTSGNSPQKSCEKMARFGAPRLVSQNF